MGITASSEVTALAVGNEYLERFCSEERLEENDVEFWDSFLSFSLKLPRTHNEQHLLQHVCKQNLENLLVNNVSTRNVITLARITLKGLESAVSDPVFRKDLIKNWQVFNGLFILRVVSKYYAETLDLVQARVQWYGKEKGIRRKSGFATHVLAKLGRTESNVSAGDEEMDITSVSNRSSFGLRENGIHDSNADRTDGTREGSLGDITGMIAPTESVNVKEEERESNEQKKKSGECEYEDIMDELLNGLFQALINLPAFPFQYPLQLQISNMLICLVSCQLYCSLNTPNYITELLMTGKVSKRSDDIVKFLLKGYIRLVRPLGGLPESSSSTLTYYFSPEWHCYVDIFAPMEDDVTVSDNCMMLLILLAVNVTYTDDYNPFYVSLSKFKDSKGKKKSLNVQEDYFALVKELDERSLAVNNADTSGGETASGFHFSFHDIYDVFCAEEINEEAMLLMYMILNCNPRFGAYVSCRSDPENILVPILKRLAENKPMNAHSLYIILIILLILSQSDKFNDRIHKVKIPDPEWYTEKVVNDITLGGATILVLLNTIQKNIASVKDVYLHTNCLAIMANMSCSFVKLHPYVCQKLVNITLLFFKKLQRYLKLEKEYVERGELSDDEAPSDSVIFGDFLRLMLQVLTNALNCNLKNNPHLIYTLLYQRESFLEMAKYPKFSELASSITKILSYFNNNVEKDKKNHWMYTYDDVISSIEVAAKEYPSDNLKPNRNLKFMYEEEQFPEEFFVPYAWALVFHKGPLGFGEKNLTLISPTYPVNKKNLTVNEQ
eukprot:Nk52_evm49s78 gene=Nk52_evmTU49s78